MKTYTTKLGDKWDLISHQQMGGVEYTSQLIEANQDYVGWYIFPAGVVLTIPEPVVPESSTLPPWRRTNEQQQ